MRLPAAHPPYPQDHSPREVSPEGALSGCLPVTLRRVPCSSSRQTVTGAGCPWAVLHRPRLPSPELPAVNSPARPRALFQAGGFFRRL